MNIKKTAGERPQLAQNMNVLMSSLTGKNPCENDFHLLADANVESRSFRRMTRSELGTDVK